MFTRIRETLGKTAVWFLIIFMMGFILGGYAMHRFQRWQIEEAIILKAFVFEKLPYDIKVRPY